MFHIRALFCQVCILYIQYKEPRLEMTGMVEKEKYYLSRFGLIMSIVANRDLEPGEEVFVSYNYDIQKAPEWYQVLSWHLYKMVAQNTAKCAD